MTIRRESGPPRLLYLSFYFPPSRASGVYRARATANHLANRGWDVTAFAAPLRFLHEVTGSVDEDLTATVDPRIRVERPEMDMYRWDKDLRTFGRFRGTFPILARNLRNRRSERFFPERYASWARASVMKALRLHAGKRFDAVLATGNPFASFAAAWLFNRLTGVPYILDYRDSWTLNLFTDAPAFPDGHPAWKWERRVLRKASSVVFVNEALRTWHAERYPTVADRMMVVPNGWDPDLMPADPAPNSGERRPLRFGYLGTLTQNQPVEELVAAFRRARTHPDLGDAELNIHGHLGFFHDSGAPLMQQLGLHEDGDDAAGDSGVHYRGPVSKTDVGSVYRDTDVLMFLAGGGKYVTSGKIFEYMASGRPIVSVHSAESAAREVLDGYPLWFNPGGVDPDDVAQAMIAAGKSARDYGPEQYRAARQHADSYARETLLEPLEARLRSLVRRPVGESS
jgi:glycosyltransferase involved in cell wall biosynthesis